MSYKITLVHSGTPTDVTAVPDKASVKTLTEGLDAHQVTVSWQLADLRDDPAYETIRYTWPGSMTRLQLRRESDDVLVFDGQIHAVSADRGEDRFTLSAQS